MGTLAVALQPAVCVFFLLRVLGGRILDMGGKFQLWSLCHYVGSSGQVVSGLWEIPQRKMGEACFKGPADHIFSYPAYVHSLAGSRMSDGVMYSTLRLLGVSTSLRSRKF